MSTHDHNNNEITSEIENLDEIVKDMRQIADALLVLGLSRGVTLHKHAEALEVMQTKIKWHLKVN